MMSTQLAPTEEDLSTSVPSPQRRQSQAHISSLMTENEIQSPVLHVSPTQGLPWEPAPYAARQDAWAISACCWSPCWLSWGKFIWERSQRSSLASVPQKSGLESGGCCSTTQAGIAATGGLCGRPTSQVVARWISLLCTPPAWSLTFHPHEG